MFLQTVSYQDRIKELVKKENIVNEAVNCISVKQDDGHTISVKTPIDDGGTDYWTLTHYKTQTVNAVADIRER